MKPYYSADPVTLYHGSCLDVLADLPDASVDAVVTDPPYGLANTTPEKIAETVTRWVNGERDYLPGGTGFMGNPWDAFVPPAAVWDDCLRVLKPGGHVLAFAGSRTMDLMGLSLRMAGFDIRDSIAWLYGSGFPKSLDVSKAIDKLGGQEGADAQEAARRALNSSPLSNGKIGQLVGVSDQLVAFWRAGSQRIERDKFEKLADIFGLPDHPPAGDRKTIGVKRAAIALPGAGVSEDEKRVGITAPATPDAERWHGWGTALKPAFEPVVVARKPLAGTVAANVLAHGTGALNIDGCRKGERWPANVVLDDHQAAQLAESRFFYVAKAGRGERPNVDGVAHPTVKPLALMRWLVRLVTPPGGTVLEPFAGSGTTVEAALLEGFNVIGVEREAEYLPLIEARIARALATDTDLFGGAA